MNQLSYGYGIMKTEFVEGLKECGIEKTDSKLKKIYNKYRQNYLIIVDDLDAFTKVACLIDAILEEPIVENPEENSKIALDIGLSVIQKVQKGIWYKGVCCDEPVQLDKVCLQTLKDDTDFWDTYYEGFLDSIKNGRNSNKKSYLKSVANLLGLPYKTAILRTIEKEKQKQIKK